MRTFHLCCLSLVIFVVACASQKPELLTHAEKSLQQAKNDTFVVKNAPLALRQAERELEQAQQVWEDEKDTSRTRELAQQASDTIAEARTRAGKSAVDELQDDVAWKSELHEKERQVYQARAEARTYRERAGRVVERNEQLSEQLSDLREQEDMRIVLENDLLFEVDRAQLKPGGKNRLQPLAEYLEDNDARHVTIEGHTDSTGGTEYNQQLSERRAQAVKQFLVAHGVEQGQIETRGLGEQMPISANDSAAGRLQNRRVEIIIEPDTRG